MKKIFTLILLAVAFVGTAKADMYLRGNETFGNWATDYKMTQATDGTYYYVFTATSTADHYFCFSTKSGNDFNGSSIRPSNNNYNLTFGQPYSGNTYSGGSSNAYYLNLEKDKSYIIAFDNSDKRVVVTYATDNLYVLGGKNGSSGTSWVSNTGTQMTKTDDYVFVCDFEIATSQTCEEQFGFSTQLSSTSSDFSSIENYRFGAQQSSGNYLISNFPNTNISLGWGHDDDHSFKIATAGTYKLVLDYKMLKLSVYQTASITTNTKGYSTYVNSNPLNISYTPGITAYYATDRGNGSADAHKLSNPVSDTPMLLKADTEEAKIYYFAVVSSGTSLSEGTTNAFKAGSSTTASGLASTTDIKYNYILNGDAFYAANNQKVAVGKAYLQLSAQATSRALVFPDDEGTGICVVTATADNADAYYNLSGQRIATPSKGLYIVNGRKVIMK